MKKNEVSMEDVYEIVVKTVNNQISSVSRFGEEAEDLVQEVMIKVYRHWGEFRDECKVESWVYSIVKNSIINLAIKHNRDKRKAVAVYSIDDNELEFEDIESGTLEEGVLYDEKILKLIALVDEELSEDDQKVFRGLLKGYSATKISDIYDLPYIKVGESIKRIRKLRLDY